MTTKSQAWIKNVIYVGLALLLVLVGWWLVVNKPGLPVANQAALKVDFETGGDWFEGSPTAPLVLIEYSDFQCPACAAFESVIGQAQEELGDQLVVVYRHFPLTSIHANAQLAAQAAEAAGQQGKFWEMHDQLFISQKEWTGLNDPTEQFAEYATELGLDSQQFFTDLTSSPAQAAINQDVTTATQLAIHSTPTFFVNGQKVPSVNSAEEFIQFLSDQLPSE